MVGFDAAGAGLINGPLTGQVAAVTGASRGIGRAIALDLARQGAFVALNFRQNEAEAEAALAEVCSRDGEGAVFRADVSRAEEVESWFRELYASKGRIDILINNAGVTRDAALLTMQAKDWQTVINTDLNSAFYCAKAVTRRMCSVKRGVIINIGSGSAFSPRVSQVNYSSAKSALIGFTRSLARELAPHGVRVNTVAPGFTATEMSQTLSQSVIADSLAKIPLNRWGRTEEIADFISYLASADAGFLNGQTLVVDGGRYALEQEYGVH
jgi:3-oxoacyl-[acyl-carrier protein] reductase